MRNRLRVLYGKRTCADVCDQLIRKLKAAGYAIDNKDKSHADVMAALETCILPKATVRDLKLPDRTWMGIHPQVLEWLENGEAPRLCGCGEKQNLHFYFHDPIGDYSMEGDGHWTPRLSRQFQINVECQTCRTRAKVVDKAVVDEIQVVVSLDGGLIEDIWAYTDGALADAKQAEQDKRYGLERDEKGFIIGDGKDAQVITFMLHLDSDEGTLAEVPSPSGKEASFMAVEGMGPASDAFTPMTEDEGTIEKSVDTLLFGQSKDQA
jgi:hypothetical protein